MISLISRGLDPAPAIIGGRNAQYWRVRLATTFIEEIVNLASSMHATSLHYGPPLGRTF